MLSCEYCKIPNSTCFEEHLHLEEHQLLKIIIKKRFLGKPTDHNGHYMINMGDQVPKIGSN